MPNGMAAAMRDYVAALSAAERTALVLKKSPWSSTGFVNVIKVKNKYQARLQVPGNGRGGSKKRKQCALPGLFDTAEEAALHLAAYKKALQDAGEAVSSPPKQDKRHKPRTKPAVPAAPQPLQPRQLPMATAMGMPMPMPMMHLPFAAASPLPMQPLFFRS